jgi:arabinosyltransferase A
VGALAWGMTLRPEPVTALLVTGVLACCVRFRERPGPAPLALACVLFPLALTAHPAGLVALAPLLAIGRTLLRSARRHIPAIATGTTVIAAEFLLLGFVGSDLEQRRLDTQTIRTLGGSTESSLNELTRYDLLAVAPYSPPLRRALVALIALAVIAFALRRFFRDGRGLLDLPATTLAIGLVLLIATPSKWPSHFGTFIGIAAIAVAAEMTALRTDRLRRGIGPLRPLLVIAFAATAIAWSWNVRGAWNQGDLRTLDWTPGFESWLPLNVVATALPLLLLGIAVVRGLLERRSVALTHVAAQTGALLALPLIVFTGVMLVVDAARTGSWTMGRQNLGTLVDEAGCGLADEMLIPGDSVAAGPEPLTRRLAMDGAPSLVLPNLLMYFPCAHLPRLTNGIAEVPRQVVSYPNPRTPIRYPVTSPWVGLLDLYRLELLPLAGRDPPQDILVYEVERDLPGAGLAEVLPASAS